MELTVDYLQLRHQYWIDRIATTGIWDKECFKPVKIEVRNRACSYDGMFHCKWIRKNGVRQLVSHLIIYQKDYDLSVRDIDDTLVHEMIHQYIIQNGLKDTSPHGLIFKEFMRRINEAFPDDVNITISAPILRLKGPGLTLHKLLLIQMNDGDCYCCKINPNKIDSFIKILYNKRLLKQIRGYLLCKSYDRYFDALTACRKYLHGEVMTFNELKDLCRECNIKRV